MLGGWEMPVEMHSGTRFARLDVRVRSSAQPTSTSIPAPGQSNVTNEQAPRRTTEPNEGIAEIVGTRRLDRQRQPVYLAHPAEPRQRHTILAYDVFHLDSAPSARSGQETIRPAGRGANPALTPLCCHGSAQPGHWDSSRRSAASSTQPREG